MMISSNKCEVVKSSERIWYDNGFFSDQRADFNLSKNIFPENTLVYVNQGTISTVKNDLAIYINFFILGQVIPAQSSPKGIESYKCKQNKTHRPIVWSVNWKFLGLDLRLAYIVSRGDQMTFF